MTTLRRILDPLSRILPDDRTHTFRTCRAEQYSTEPVRTERVRAFASTLEHLAQLGLLEIREDGGPVADVASARATDQGGGQQGATEGGVSDVQIAGSLYDSYRSIEQLINDFTEDSRDFLLDLERSIRQAITHRRAAASPQPTLGSVAESSGDATRLVIRFLCGNSAQDPRMQATVVGREVYVPLRGGHTSQFDLRAAIDQALQVSRLTDQTIKVVRDETMSLVKIADHLLELRSVTLVGTDIVVLVDPRCYSDVGRLVGSTPPTLRNDNSAVIELPPNPRA